MNNLAKHGCVRRTWGQLSGSKGEPDEPGLGTVWDPAIQGAGR